MTADEHFMTLALQVAELGRGQTSPNPLVGAVVVRDGVVIGQGAHLKAGSPHAEVHALRMAGDSARGATVYVTLEPCAHFGRTPPCTEALIAAGVRRVVAACEDPNPEVAGRGFRQLREAGVEVVEGVLTEQAALQNEAYFTWRRFGRPLVTWKCAATLDGYIATHTGDSFYVTSEIARASVHQLRADHDAIAVGIGTVLADDPRLTVRLASAEDRWLPQPLRVVFDSQRRLPPAARMLQEPGRTLVYTTRSGDDAVTGRTDVGSDATGPTWVTLPANDSGRVPLAQALHDLGQRGITSLLVESGGTLASTLMAQGLVDKVVYYLAPKFLGGGLRALDGMNIAEMQHALPLTDIQVTLVGPDVRVEGRLTLQH